MNWWQYALALLAFNALGVLSLYLLQRFQAVLPLNPAGMAAVSLDPSQAPPEVPQEDISRRVSSKLGIDATRKHAFPAVAVPPKEHLDLVRKNWQSYGF